MSPVLIIQVRRNHWQWWTYS